MEYHCFVLLTLLLTIWELGIASEIPVVDVVITVKTDVFFVKQVVLSLIKHMPDQAELGQRIIFVDDDSPDITKVYIADLCRASPLDFICIATKVNDRGYTRAANLGVSYGSNYSKAIVLLNSDVIVTDGWLVKLYDSLFHGDPKTRIVGPLSNAASFQSIPNMTAPNGDWSTNPFPPGMDVDSMARRTTEYAARSNLVSIPIMVLNGFCYMFRRELVEEIGSFDSVNFPSGYGEEVDFSIRTEKAGFTQYVIPSVYIWHKKTASFSPSNKNYLKKSSRKYLENSYGKEIFKKIDRVSRKINDLDGIRKHTLGYYNKFYNQLSHVNYNASILFVLHDLAIAGGIVSVLQEAWQMSKFGVNVALAFPTSVSNSTSVIRSLLPGIEDTELHHMVRQYNGTIIGNSTTDPTPASFIDIAKDYDIVVATFCKTMRAVQDVSKQYPHILPAYYVQDYEPWFWKSPYLDTMRDQDGLDEALATYVKGTAFMISKTRWTADMVMSNHKSTVHMVVPSLDHSVYYPSNTLLGEKLRKTGDKSMFRVIAMIRPRTPRRNALNTLEVLLRLAYNYPNTVKVSLFGCTRPWLNNAMKKLTEARGKGPYRQKSLPIPLLKNVEFMGILVDRVEIANFYRNSDIFIDLSWWQAFGRTAMEAMATGCVSIMPLEGAAREICKDSKYCLYHDGNDVDGYYNKLVVLIQDDKRRYDLIQKGIARMQTFSINIASATIAQELKRGYDLYRQNGRDSLG